VSRRCGFAIVTDRRPRAGFGLVEFLVALLVLSLGILHVLHSQLFGIRLVQEGAQHSIATALARDLVTRIQLNPHRVSGYRVDRYEDIYGQHPPPSVDCAEVLCDAAQMSAYEWWQWRRLVRGLPVGSRSASGEAPGAEGRPALSLPAVCVAYADAVATVTVGWFSPKISGRELRYDCLEGDVVSALGDDVSRALHTVKLHAWIGRAD